VKTDLREALPVSFRTDAALQTAFWRRDELLRRATELTFPFHEG
jgi:hypothetical protein